MKHLLFAAAVVRANSLVRPALGTVMYLRSRDLLASQRASVLAALGEVGA